MDKKLSKRIDALKRDFENILDELIQENESLEEEVSKMETELNDLNETIEKMSEEIQDLKQ